MKGINKVESILTSEKLVKNQVQKELNNVVKEKKIPVDEIPASTIRANFLPTRNKYSDFKLTRLLDEYVAQKNYNGANIEEIKAELIRRGLPTMAEHPEQFFRP